MGLYQASLITRRVRRTKLEVTELDDKLFSIVQEQQPVIVRQAFYVAVGLGLVPKVEEYAGYGVVQFRLLKMRRSGRLPYDWVVDESRIVMGPNLYPGPEEFLRQEARLYRLDLWLNRPVRVQVWCEKLSIAGVLADVTYPTAVQLYPARGFSSETFVWRAAQEIRLGFEEHGQRTVVLYVGDWDPSGRLMDPDIERRLVKLGAGDAISEFRRVAVTQEQVREWKLPTRPTKRRGNPHARSFRGPSVEVEAVPPARLRELLTAAIRSYHDEHELKVLETIEAEQIRGLEMLATLWRRRDKRR